MIVKCIRKCWDSGRCRKYYPGDQDDIDPLEPIAGNFEFPPGTEVYFKKRGTKDTPAVSTTRIVPGNVEEVNKIKSLESEETLLLKKLENVKKQKEALQGGIKKAPEQKPAEEVIACDICGIYKGNLRQVKLHQVSCKKRALSKEKEQEKVGGENIGVQ